MNYMILLRETTYTLTGVSEREDREKKGEKAYLNK